MTRKWTSFCGSIRASGRRSNSHSKRTNELYRYEANRYLSDWLARPLDQITRWDVEARFNGITADHGWSPANRAMSLLRSIYRRPCVDREGMRNPVDLWLAGGGKFHRKARRKISAPAEVRFRGRPLYPLHECVEERNGKCRIPVFRAVNHAADYQRIPGRAELLRGFTQGPGNLSCPMWALHTAAYWLMLALRDAVPRRMPLHWAEFVTLRQKLLKNLPRTRSGGGARVVEKAGRVRIYFASACTDAALFRMLTGRLAASGP